MASYAIDDRFQWDNIQAQRRERAAADATDTARAMRHACCLSFANPRTGAVAAKVPIKRCTACLGTVQYGNHYRYALADLHGTSPDWPPSGAIACNTAAASAHECPINASMCKDSLLHKGAVHAEGRFQSALNDPMHRKLQVHGSSE